MTCLRTTLTVRLVRTTLLTMALAATAACAGDTDTTSQSPAPATTEVAYPEWLESVYPPPGAETTVTQAVQVNHNVVAADQEIRLSINGTDVTVYANETSPGLLEYDMDQDLTPVELRPGEHEATVELYRVTPGASEGVESFDEDVRSTTDSFSWTFTIH